MQRWSCVGCKEVGVCCKLAQSLFLHRWLTHEESFGRHNLQKQAVNGPYNSCDVTCINTGRASSTHATLQLIGVSQPWEGRKEAKGKAKANTAATRLQTLSLSVRRTAKKGKGGKGHSPAPARPKSPAGPPPGHKPAPKQRPPHSAYLTKDSRATKGC